MTGTSDGPRRLDVRGVWLFEITVNTDQPGCMLEALDIMLPGSSRCWCQLAVLIKQLPTSSGRVS